MNRSVSVLLVTVALGSLVALVEPGAALMPGELLPGHAQLRDDCLACHELLHGVRRDRCARCHDPTTIGVVRVGGAVAAEPRESVAALHRNIGQAECALCHAEHAGRLDGDRAARFEHEALPVETRVGCGACHAGQRPDDAIHADADEQCGACHGTVHWKPATFDHAKYFRFDGHHPARCADCHAPGAGFRTYSCAGCHEHDPARIEAKHRKEGITDVSDCAKCHPSGDEDESRRPDGMRREDRGRHREEESDEDD